MFHDIEYMIHILIQTSIRNDEYCIKVYIFEYIQINTQELCLLSLTFQNELNKWKKLITK